MQTFLVPSNTSNKIMEELNKLYSANYVRVGVLSTYKKKVSLSHWKDNLVKNGVRI